VARGSSVLAKSVTPSRIDENMTLITLNDEDMEHLDNVSKTKGLTRFVYPAFGVSTSSCMVLYKLVYGRIN
jgi:glycerol 2-dehydrogenase (NADP+)